MIKLSRNQLLEITQVMVLANTPLSLLKGLVRSSAVQILRTKCSPEELIEYYDHITVRPRRSEIVMALAYAVLSAILLKARDAKRIPVDATRLFWGEQIQDHMSRMTVRTSLTHIPKEKMNPRVHAHHVNSPSASLDTPPILVGPDGNPLLWRNNS